MRIQKKYLVLFYKLLTETKLNLVDSRVRDEFFKDLLEKTKDFEQARQTIFKEFCIKDEEGIPKLTGKNEFQFEDEKVDELTKEINTLLDEEVEFNIKNPDKIKEFIENTKYEPLTGETKDIDFIISLIV